MKSEQQTDPAPLRDRRVELAVARLNAELRGILGAETTYVLVISRDFRGVDHIQATTNSTATRAHELLRAADACGFDSLN